MTARTTDASPNLNRGIIGNASLAAMIDDTAGLDWMCAPRMDGDPVFCGLLGDQGAPGEGSWRFRLHGQQSSTQRYLRNTAILETILTDVNPPVDPATISTLLGTVTKESPDTPRAVAVMPATRVRSKTWPPPFSRRISSRYARR